MECCICKNAMATFRYVPCYHCCLCGGCAAEIGNPILGEDDKEDDRTFNFDEDDQAVTYDRSGFDDDDSIFFNYSPQYTIHNSLLKKCPLCQVPASRIEAYHHVPPTWNPTRIAYNEEYHYSGIKRGCEETTTLKGYVKANSNLLRTIKPGNRRLFYQ